MADEFHAGICSSMSWWNTVSRNPTSSFDPPPSISCSSTEIRDITAESNINWTQPNLSPLELNQFQAGFGDSPMNDLGLLPVLFDPLLNPFRDMMNDPSPVLQPSWADNRLSRVSSPSSNQQVNFNNSAPFWNTLATKASPPPKESLKRPETKKQGGDHQPAAKKPRISTPSPLPTFKVRKEKLGDRITALQQLVSPFGKTDTASVLHEAIEYIKFLHGQVGALSSPYLKNGHPMQHQHQESWESLEAGVGQDLRSRGLCLVPISSTFAVASETPMEFWAPTFLGSYI